ncbi:MAG: sugar phosphate isomerase/epimerase [Defluviitaleaceae bacterium]|nr:sugar phosphate isomerase/epimerase [Defluviitaleaceae bacterium]
MKLSINTWSFNSGTIKEKMALAKRAEFDGIELTLNETGELGLDASDAELASYKNYAGEIGLPIHCLATGLYWPYPFSSGDAAVRDKAVSIALTQLKFAKALGADAILVVPGAVGVDFLQGGGTVSYEIAYDRALEGMNKIKKTAEELKISVGIENVWNKFLLSPLEMRDFIDKINSPYARAYFDVGNILAYGYPEQWIKILGSRICKVHVKDYKRGSHDFVDLLAGDVDWPAVNAALKETGYDGWVTAEMGCYRYFNEQMVYRTAAAMKEIFI